MSSEGTPAVSAEKLGVFHINARWIQMAPSMWGLSRVVHCSVSEMCVWSIHLPLDISGLRERPSAPVVETGGRGGGEGGRAIGLLQTFPDLKFCVAVTSALKLGASCWHVH